LIERNLLLCVILGTNKCIWRGRTVCSCSVLGRSQRKEAWGRRERAKSHSGVPCCVV